MNRTAHRRPTASPFPALTAVLLAGLGVAACAGSPPDAGTVTPSRAEELEAIYRARADSARMRFTEADVHFMTGMIAHHGQALVMAAMAPRNDAGEEVRRLTARIFNAQRDEIATMQRWLRERDQSVPEVEVAGDSLIFHGPEHAMHMPGVLSRRQMNELAAARGPQFDRLFLRYMIEHHRGAVTMVENLFATDGAAQDDLVFKLASDIQVDQRTEIARMQRMLEARAETGGDPRP
jgi:uncharacterized protein (DUF305 family)